MDSSFYGMGDTFYSKEFPKVPEFEIEIMLQPSTIKNYIESMQELQSLDMSEYFPLSERAVKLFFSKIDPKFEGKSIKYSDSDNLDIICQIISYVGRSGYNYIKSADNIITLNQPVLIFYGIEQLSTYFTFMHFNFTGENMKINSIRDKFRRHGINPGEFNNVKSDSLIDELLDKKISLLTEGAAQRFFFSLGFPVWDYFFRKLEYSLRDLIHIFFRNLNIGLSNKTIQNFINDFDVKEDIQVDHHEDLNLFIFYILSFLFSHLSRYKIYTWQKLMGAEEKNLGVYIKFILNTIKQLYVRKLFAILGFEKDRIPSLKKHQSRRKVFKERWDKFLEEK